MLAIWLCLIAKCLLVIWQQPIAKHMLAILATSYCLNRNNRVSSFYWTRGSKLCFLTCFSYFSCYFHTLVFLQNCYLLILFCAFLGCTGIRFLVPFLLPLALWASLSYMRPHISGTEPMGFSKQDARGNLVVDSQPVIFPLSAFCKRFLVQTTIGLNANHTFLTHYNPWTDTFLHDLGLAKLHSTARVWNPQRISNSWIRLIVACLMTDSLHFAQGDSAGLTCYKILCSRILNVPLPYGMHLKVSPKGRHIFEQLRPQQHRSAMNVTRNSRGWSLSIPFLHFSWSGA